MAQSNFTLQLKSPCSQDWNKMTETACGKYCANCSKEVIDFSFLSDEEIVKKINQSNKKLCARLDMNQLDRPLLLNKKYSFKLPKTLAGFFLLGLAKTSYGIKKDNLYLKPSYALIASVQNFEKVNVPEKDTIDNRIYGRVKDSKSGEILDNATILIRETKNGTISGPSGKFTLHLPDSLANSKIYITISSVGYSDLTFALNPNDFHKAGNNTIKDYFLNPITTMLLGEVVVVKKRKWWQL